MDQSVIGLGVASLLHSNDYCVAICGIDSCGLCEVDGMAFAKRLDSSGGTAVFIACNPSVYESQKMLFQCVWDKWQRLDVVIINAGLADLGCMPGNADETCQEANLTIPSMSIHLATHYMRQNSEILGGNVIITRPASSRPCPAKFGLNHYVGAVAPALLLRDNISITCPPSGPLGMECLWAMIQLLDS